MPDAQDYAEMLGDALKPGFVIGELVRVGSPRHVMPPEHMWHRMVAPLLLANELRWAMREHGVKGLRVNAAYRPKGGAKSSQHKANRALDLDLLPGDYDKTRLYYEEAVRLWCRRGHNQEVGLGLYCPRDAQQGIRVHIDVGYHSRHWQHGPGAGKSDAIIIAERLGLHIPGRPEPDDDEGSDEP